MMKKSSSVLSWGSLRSKNAAESSHGGSDSSLPASIIVGSDDMKKRRRKRRKSKVTFSLKNSSVIDINLPGDFEEESDFSDDEHQDEEKEARMGDTSSSFDSIDESGPSRENTVLIMDSDSTPMVSTFSRGDLARQSTQKISNTAQSARSTGGLTDAYQSTVYNTLRGTIMKAGWDFRNSAIKHVHEPKYMFGLYWWFKYGDSSVINPTVFYKASGNILGLTLMASWILTFIFNRESIYNNPLLDRLGYNDLCVGWDTAPANYVGIVGTGFFSFLGLRFCFTNKTRIDILHQYGKITERQHYIGISTTRMYALAMLVFPIIFVCPPTKSVWIHSIPFLYLIVANFLVYAGLFLTFPDEFARGDKIFLFIVGIVSIAFPACVLGEYFAYANNGGHKSSFPYWITGGLDKLWFCCLWFSSKFLPAEIVLTVGYDLGFICDDSVASSYKTSSDLRDLTWSLDNSEDHRAYDLNEDITPDLYRASKIVRFIPHDPSLKDAFPLNSRMSNDRSIISYHTVESQVTFPG